MINRCLVLSLIGLVFFVGCSRPVGRPYESKKAASGSIVPMLAEAPQATQQQDSTAGTSGESQRFIAVRHKLMIEIAATELPEVWKSVNEFCHTIRCQIVASSISNNTYSSPPHATLSVRVVPEDSKRLFEYLEKVGNVLEHSTESEDKTGIVIDVDAKIKNLIQLRDRLRTMLGTATAGLKDLVEVERELSRAQSELDRLMTARKVLAGETEKIAVDIVFRSKRSAMETGVFAPVVSAWHESGHVLADSIGLLITCFVAVIPWLVASIPSLWLLLKLFRRLFRKRTGGSIAA